MTIKRTQPLTSTSAVQLVGRMRQDVTPEMIEATLGPAVRSIGSSLSVVPLTTAMTARLLALARGASLASALVIVVCWINVFNIALTRGFYREPELATRTALGAAPSQLIGLLVTEGLRVAVIGSASGMDEQTQPITVAHDPGLPPAVRSEVVERVVTALRRSEGVQAAGVRSSGMLDGRMDFQSLMIDGQFAALDWTAWIAAF